MSDNGGSQTRRQFLGAAAGAAGMLICTGLLDVVPALADDGGEGDEHGQNDGTGKPTYYGFVWYWFDKLNSEGMPAQGWDADSTAYFYNYLMARDKDIAHAAGFADNPAGVDWDQGSGLHNFSHVACATALEEAKTRANTPRARIVALGWPMGIDMTTRRLDSGLWTWSNGSYMLDGEYCCQWTHDRYALSVLSFDAANQLILPPPDPNNSPPNHGEGVADFHVGNSINNLGESTPASLNRWDSQADTATHGVYPSWREYIRSLHPVYGASGGASTFTAIALALAENEAVPVGSLRIRKVVMAGNAGTRKFSMHLVITATDGTTYLDTTFELGHNESRLFERIPAGYTYEISETVDSDVRLDKVVAEVGGATITNGVARGTIQENVEHSVRFENLLLFPLRVSKVVTGPDALETGRDSFSFRVDFEGSYAPSAQTFPLKNGESKLIEGIPGGVTAKVSETTHNHYDTTWNPASGSVVMGAVAGEVTVTATNKRKVGAFEILKEVDGPYDTHQFTFDVSITRDDGSAYAMIVFKLSASGALTVVSNTNSSVVVASAGKACRISNVPSDYRFAISERFEEHFRLRDFLPSASGAVAAGEVKRIVAHNVANGYATIEKRLNM